jgi:hypothetical protein
MTAPRAADSDTLAQENRSKLSRPDGGPSSLIMHNMYLTKPFDAEEPDVAVKRVMDIPAE